MDATTVGIIGAVVTVFSVLLTHWLGQRGGRERADQVRDELTSRLSGLDSRLTEVKGDLKDLIRDSKTDSLTAIGQVRTELQTAIGDAKNDSLTAIGYVRAELHTAIADAKNDSLTAIGHVRAELHTAIADAKNDSLTAIGHVRAELHTAIADAKNDSLSAIGQVRSELQGSMVRIEARIDAAKETYSRELNAMRTEILDAIPKRARQAASGEAER